MLHCVCNCTCSILLKPLPFLPLCPPPTGSASLPPLFLLEGWSWAVSQPPSSHTVLASRSSHSTHHTAAPRLPGTAEAVAGPARCRGGDWDDDGDDVAEASFGPCGVGVERGEVLSGSIMSCDDGDLEPGPAGEEEMREVVLRVSRA